ncbi:MAG: RNA-directed DNA polymerase [Clostridiales bacterium]|nr:RNA-directed DNA polymerase [Clostridiales bacterium]
MNSAERHERRYQRRKARRDARRIAAGSGTLEEILSFGNLCRAGKKCCNGSRWKSSTINFEYNMLAVCKRILREVLEGRRKFAGFQSFITIEHGKARPIDAVKITDRTLQKCLCDNILIKAFSRGFIYDNGACLKGKGMDFQLKRLRKHLTRHFHKHGTEGGIYQYDFKSYFKSIPHDGIKERARRVIVDDRVHDLFCSLVDDFERMKDADPDEHKGVGLGSEISQIIALDYASPIDHYVKDVLGVSGYGRYNDDGYVISDSLEFLHKVKDALYKLAADIGIKMSDKKNIITPFKNHSFTFLKMRFSLKESGRIVCKLGKRSIRTMRRKIHKFRQWVTDHTFTLEDAIEAYQSWRAHAKRCDSYDTLTGMDKLFVGLFKKELAKRRRKFKCTAKAEKVGKEWVYMFNEKEAA